MTSESRECIKCNVVYPILEFRSYKDKYSLTCRLCRNARHNEYVRKRKQNEINLIYKDDYDKSFIGFKTETIEVVEYVGDKKMDSYWRCRCLCGKFFVRSKSRILYRKETCGCSRTRTGDQNPGWKGHGEISQAMWQSIVFRSKGRGKNKVPMDFDITIEFVWDLFLKQNRKCALTGVPIKFSARIRDRDRTASLDRIDSNGGYTKDNVRWVHRNINLMKNIMSDEEFIEWCMLVADIYVTKLIDKDSDDVIVSDKADTPMIFLKDGYQAPKSNRLRDSQGQFLPRREDIGGASNGT